MTLVEFAIGGPPVSQQARRRGRVRDYIREVGSRAASAYGGQLPYKGMVRVEITYIHAIAFDVDNIAKPILDGLKGTVVADDAQVMDILVSKRPLTWSRFDNPSPLLRRMLATQREFIHVLVARLDA